MKQYEVKYLDVSTNETLAYRECGSGPTLLLLHGNMSSSLHYQILMEALEDSYHIIALDLVGFGDSTYNRRLDSLHDFSLDVQAFIKALDLKDIAIMGWSTGGGIALEVAADMPGLIKQVILLDSVGMQGFVMVNQDGSRITSKEEIENHPIQVVPILQAYATRNKEMLKYIWNATIYTLNVPNDEDYDHYLEAMLKQRNLVDVDYALVHFNMTDQDNGVNPGSNRLSAIKAPVLIIHGAHDLVVPLSESQKYHDYFKDQSELVVFEHAGHSVITDDLSGLVLVLKEKV